MKKEVKKLLAYLLALADCTYLGIYRADRDKDDSKSSNT